MNQFLARLDRCSEIGSLDSYGWYPSGHRPMANLEGACYVPGHIAPGLRSSRLLLESEPLLRSVLVLHEDLVLVSSAPLPRGRDLIAIVR